MGCGQQRQYIDYRLALGPIILGHAYDEVDEKVIEEVRDGVLFAMTGELELDVAEMIVEMCSSVEAVRTACSGLRRLPCTPSAWRGRIPGANSS